MQRDMIHIIAMCMTRAQMVVLQKGYLLTFYPCVFDTDKIKVRFTVK